MRHFDSQKFLQFLILAGELYSTILSAIQIESNNKITSLSINTVLG